MNALIRSTLVAAVAVVAAAGCAKETSTAIPTGTDLKGTWAQNGFGYEMGKPVTWKDQTLVIEKAEGAGFAGFKEYNREGSGPQKEAINGVVGADGDIRIVDEDGFFEGRLVEGKIRGQYVEMGDDAADINVELTRK